MRRMCVAVAGSIAAVLAVAAGSPAGAAEVLTVDRAVQIALQKSTQMVNAEAAVIEARAGLYSSYAELLPRVSGLYDHSGSWTNHSVGNTAFGGFVTPSRNTYDVEGYSTTPQLTGSWTVLSLSALSGWRAAGSVLKGARLERTASRNDVALAARRQFYQVVQTIQIARVNTEALKLSRDDERRVRALFEVGSVSRSDLLKAQVRTAQSELDSLTSHQAVTVQRINLASAMGVRESEMGEVDTVLTADVKEFDREALLAEATRSRPDLRASEAQAQAARLDVRSAKLARLPYVTVSGTAQFDAKRRSDFKQPETVKIPDPDHPGEFIDTGVEIPGSRVPQATRSKTDRLLGASVALNWNIFDGFATDALIASARARRLRAEEARDALRRNLESEVDQALITYREAVERDRVGHRALESAEENLKLTQQKYNVGSATILELIDAQVQLQRARGDLVTAQASIRVAEAQIDRVRGRAE